MSKAPTELTADFPDEYQMVRVQSFTIPADGELTALARAHAFCSVVRPSGDEKLDPQIVHEQTQPKAELAAMVAAAKSYSDRLPAIVLVTGYDWMANIWNGGINNKTMKGKKNSELWEELDAVLTGKSTRMLYQKSTKPKLALKDGVDGEWKKRGDGVPVFHPYDEEAFYQDVLSEEEQNHVNMMNAMAKDKT